MAENITEEISKIEEVDSNVVFQQDRAQIDIQVSTAHAYPRNVTQSTTDAIAIVTLDIETAKACTYSVPRGDKSISGPSVHLARILAQQWGNMRVEAKVVSIDARQITSSAVAWDLQKNLAIKIEVKRSIIGKKGRFNDDMITVTGNAANAIAMRNAILAVLPRGVVDKVYSASKAFITGDLSTETKMIAKRKEVVDKLKDTYNVTEKEVLDAIGRSAVSHITADDIITLIGFGTAIKEGDATVDNTFRGGKSVSPTEIVFDDLKELFELKKDAMKPEDKTYGERIIEKKEVKSYKKLHDLLLTL